MTATIAPTGAAAPERKATDHTAVILPGHRKNTLLSTGVIPAKAALDQARYDGVIFQGHNFTTQRDMRIGRELPLFEIAFDGYLYRIQCRPLDVQAPETTEDYLVYELVRTVAPGMNCGGQYMERPVGVPNTPRALVNELRFMTGARMADLVEKAYSIFHYRLDHQGKYPESMTPAGYTLREVFLMSDVGDGEMRTLYETPAGVNPERWTLFLVELDKQNHKLAAYVTSSMALREFGEKGVAAMREALKIRNPKSLVGVVPLNFTPFLSAFPVPEYQTKLQRTVGTSAGFL